MNKIDTVIKIGGSIVKKQKKIRDIADKIVKLTKEGYKIVIIPGGGRLVEDTRKMYKKYDISEEIAHWMAIKAMDINGMFITDLNRDFISVDTIKECEEILSSNQVPVFLTYNFLKKQDELPKSWDVTSDSISLYMTHILNAQYNILLKDVDGIYEGLGSKKIIDSISAEKILQRDFETCVDNYFPYLIKKYNRKAYIVSGFHPERIKQVLKGENVTGTVVMS